MRIWILIFHFYLVSIRILECVPIRIEPKNEKYFEGDIRFPENFDPKNGIIGDEYRWPNNTVYYSISADFDSDESLFIASSLSEIQEKTCIKFIAGNVGDHVHFERNNNGCWSDIGRRGGQQIINLQPQKCIDSRTVRHEMLHAIGLYHEQARSDRDDYVTIVWNNIPKEEHHNFNKYTSNSMGFPYDYGSLMHYRWNEFAIDPSKPTIIPKRDVEIGVTDGLTDSDARKIRKMYDCP